MFSRPSTHAALGGGFLFLLLLLLSNPAAAVPVYGTDAGGELIGSRDVDAGGGLTGFNDYGTNFTVSWVIDFGITTPGKWHYEYTFTGLNSKDISHFVIDLSDDCITDPDPECVTGAKLNDSVIDAGDIEFGDKDGIIGSVKFDVEGGEGAAYEFDSNRSPVYGHLAIKDGGGNSTCADAPGGVGNTNVVCSNGLLAGADTMDINDYVARPNGPDVPEPGTLLLLLTGALGLCSTGRARPRESRVMSHATPPRIALGSSRLPDAIPINAAGQVHDCAERAEETH